MHSFATEADNYDTHPVSYHKIDNAQRRDAAIKKILKQPTSSYYINPLLAGGLKGS